MFSIKQSFDKFKVENVKEVELDVDAVGVPLFYMVNNHDIVAYVSAKKPLYVVYRYVLEELQRSPPPYSKIILHNDIYCLYKVPYCEIYRSRGFTKTRYKLLFLVSSKAAKEYEMIKDKFSKQFEISIEGSSLLWDVACQNNSSFSYDLRLQDSYASQDGSASNMLLLTGPGAIIGQYSPRIFKSIPRTTYNCADLWINENSRPETFGITSVPLITEVLACQGMLVHRTNEDRR
ncbi:uncharacterized protein ZBIST_4997 [Zygosaccharomyces bailii]|nr:uncharacterized protein ZBIST_4997 [Zygosaccharomyces bailii]